MFEPKHRVRIETVYPDLSSEQQAEAEYSLTKYAMLVWRIYERTKRRNPKLLTELLKRDRV